MAYREPAKWNPAAQGRRAGGEGRAAMPDSAFAYVRTIDGKKERKFPYKIYRGGEWINSRKGCMAARNRAAQQIEAGRTQYISVFNKMSRILRSEFGYSDMAATWAAHVKERDK